MTNYFSKMYGGPLKSSSSSSPSPKPVDKSAVRQLSGMKVHGSHVKQVEIGDQIVDVPKIEYVNLLDSQLKEARAKIKRLEEQLERTNNRYLKLAQSIQEIQRDLANTVRYK